MTRAAALVGTRKSATPKVNLAGGKTYRRSIEEQSILALMANTLSDTFYSPQKDIVEDTINVLTEMRDKDPLFLAKAIVYAREEGFMQLAPVMGLAILSAGQTLAAKASFKRIFSRVIRTPDNLREFVTICRSKKVRGGFGGIVTKATANWLLDLTEFQATKYGSSASKDITLRDVLRMAHPNPSLGTDPRALEERFGWLVKGWENIGEDPSDTNPQIWAFEKLKRSESEEEILGLIKDYRLSWEVVVPSVKKMTTPIWEALMPNMPYMALLRHLETFDRHGVLANENNVDLIVARLTDENALRKAMILPFRLYSARVALTKQNYKITSALEKALEFSVKNAPVIPGVTAIGSDVSGSMGATLSDRSSVKYVDLCAIFSAILAKQNPNTIVMPFDTQLHKMTVSPNDTVMTYASTMAKYGGGGTSVGLPIQELLSKNKKIDTFIGITDSEDWAYGGWYRASYSFYDTWTQYKKLYPDAKAYLINLVPTRDYVAPENAKDVMQISGWSDNILKLISMHAAGLENQVQVVRNFTI